MSVAIFFLRPFLTGLALRNADKLRGCSVQSHVPVGLRFAFVIFLALTLSSTGLQTALAAP